LLRGKATASGTKAYRAALKSAVPADHFRSWQGLAVSSIGLGTYLGPEDEVTDRAYQSAIEHAVAGGLNVVDSAINYRRQRSERAVGSALAALHESGRVKREGVVVATKGGFLPFDGPAPKGLLGPGDLVAGTHCMSPHYLEDQLQRSLANLGLERVDIYYVHNPETQLAELPRAAVLDRLQAAFEFLEGAARSGSIGVYGTATWTAYRQPPEAQDALSLAEVVAAAKAVGGAQHHFRVVQLPYNLAMTEAFTAPSQPRGRERVTALELARALGVYVMTSASIYQGQLARNLPPVIGQFLPGLSTDAQRALQFVRSTPGVGTALCGMRSIAHVDEALGLASVAPVPWAQFQKLFAPA
jgi:aryl-alcohol dehydrogenase-like predicted oxidoreductase